MYMLWKAAGRKSLTLKMRRTMKRTIGLFKSKDGSSKDGWNNHSSTPAEGAMIDGMLSDLSTSPECAECYTESATADASNRTSTSTSDCEGVDRDGAVSPAEPQRSAEVPAQMTAGRSIGEAAPGTQPSQSNEKSTVIMVASTDLEQTQSAGSGSAAVADSQPADSAQNSVVDNPSAQANQAAEPKEGKASEGGQSQASESGVGEATNSLVGVLGAKKFASRLKKKAKFVQSATAAKMEMKNLFHIQSIDDAQKEQERIAHALQGLFGSMGLLFVAAKCVPVTEGISCSCRRVDFCSTW